MEDLDFTDHGDGTVTLNNDPAPDSISIARVPWQHMVNGDFAWAVVTEVLSDPEDEFSQLVQVLAIEADNVSATFRWTDTGPGRTTFLDTTNWVAV